MRDSKQIRKNNYPCFCSSTNPIDALDYWGIVEYQKPISLPGLANNLRICPGDWVYGDVDAVIIGNAGQGYQGVNADQVRLLPEGVDALGFIFPKGSPLVADVDQAIADLRADGTLDALIKKWFIDNRF